MFLHPGFCSIKIVLSHNVFLKVSEAMKAQSQAFVTEDGTAVKKDEKVGNPLKLSRLTFSAAKSCPSH